MDIVLERILSLLPKKEDGSFVRGAKKNFAQSIGYDSGDIVSMWINGSSTSYKGKVHEIASRYNVPVEWLEGKTDVKDLPENEQLVDFMTDMMAESPDSFRRRFISLISEMGPDDWAFLEKIADQLAKKEKADQ